MEKLTEAVVNLINEDVVKGKKIIENELYSRLGVMLEEKLKDYAPTIFEAKLSPKQKKIAAKAGNPEEIEGEDFAALRKMSESVDADQPNLINEEYEELVDEIQAIVEEVEAESGKELSESEIEEIANLVLESYENDIDEDEFEDDEDIEEEEEE